MKKETIKTNTLQCEVPMDWLMYTLEKMAIEDSNEVTNNKQDYILGRKDHLYEELENPFFAEEIVGMAKEDKVILNLQTI